MSFGWSGPSVDHEACVVDGVDCTVDNEVCVVD